MKTVFGLLLIGLLLTNFLTAPALAQAADSDAAAMATGREVATTDDGTLSEEARQELVGLLERSRQQLEMLAAQAAGEAWSSRPGEGRWSPGEVVEHVALAEEGLFTLALEALEGEEDPEWKTLAGGSAESMVSSFQDRSQKFPAPEQFEPKGHQDRIQLLGRYALIRTKVLDFVRTTQAPLERHTAAGPAGKMNVRQWLALIAGHNLRHNAQIQEALEQLAAGE